MKRLRLLHLSNWGRQRKHPTGIDANDQSNIWSITGHTRSRPEGEEVVVFDAQGKNRRVFYNRTSSTIHVECGPEGGPVVSLGENFGKDWTLPAKDGSKVTGRGERGVFRCTAEGTKIRRIAKGFWPPSCTCSVWIRTS